MSNGFRREDLKRAKALSHYLRVEIVQELQRNGPLKFAELSKALQIPRYEHSRLVYHLKVLQQAELVDKEENMYDLPSDPAKYAIIDKMTAQDPLTLRMMLELKLLHGALLYGTTIMIVWLVLQNNTGHTFFETQEAAISLSLPPIIIFLMSLFCLGAIPTIVWMIAKLTPKDFRSWIIIFSLPLIPLLIEILVDMPRETNIIWLVLALYALALTLHLQSLQGIFVFPLVVSALPIVSFSVAALIYFLKGYYSSALLVGAITAAMIGLVLILDCFLYRRYRQRFRWERVLSQTSVKRKSSS